VFHLEFRSCFEIPPPAPSSAEVAAVVEEAPMLPAFGTADVGVDGVDAVALAVDDGAAAWVVPATADGLVVAGTEAAVTVAAIEGGLAAGCRGGSVKKAGPDAVLELAPVPVWACWRRMLLASAAV